MARYQHKGFDWSEVTEMSATNLLLLIPVIYVILQWSALRRMRDGWRMAAALPGILMGACLLILIFGIAMNANMAAIWFVLGLPVATVYLLLLLPLHWMMSRHT